MKKTTRPAKQLKPEFLSSRLASTDRPFESSVLREINILPSFGEAISVRAAKTHLSGLLDLVVNGREIIITSDGKPKVRLVPIDSKKERKPFGSTWEHLKKIPWRGGPTADEIVRADRDGRGW